MEYVDYYLRHLLTHIHIPVGSEVLPEGGTIILNNISGINYNEALRYAEQIVIEDKRERVLLSEKVFINDVTLQEYLGELDAKKLWELCVLLYSMLANRLILTLSLTKADEYLKLFNELERGIELTSIEFKGTVDGKTKKVVLQNHELINEMAALFIYHLHNITVANANLENYNNNKWTTLGELVDKRCVDYLFAKELEEFMKDYFDTKRITSNDKMLILHILYLFGRFKNNPPTNTDIYRKLMSDGQKLQISNSISLLNGEPLPFIIIPDPNIIKIREEYNRLNTGKCEISK